MPKIALVHEWFNEPGGSEEVVREILHCFPDADVYCLFDFFNQKNRDIYLNGKKTHRSFIQHLPFAKRRYRNFFPLFPYAIERFDLRGYDLILSSSSCVAKGIRHRPGQLHISYCHSPARYVWDLQEDYVRAVQAGPAKAVLRYFFEKLKKWDLASNERVDHFIANSAFVSQRIKNFYGRESTVIYPPVDVTMKHGNLPRSNVYITVSRLVTYKNIDLIVEAFRRLPDLKLEVAGDGPLRKKIMKNLPPNITYLGYIDDATKHRKLSEAKAFVAAATEDFGISIVEAQSYCTPVIIPSVGGYKETVSQKTGVFFHEKTVEDMVATLRAFDADGRIFDPQDFENNIRPFCKERFRSEFKTFVEEKYHEHLTSAGR